MTPRDQARALASRAGLIAAVALFACVEPAYAGRDRDRERLLPDGAEIVYHRGGQLWTMDADGRRATQITSGPARDYEHAAVSHDRRYVATNAFDGGSPHVGGRSRLYVLDLATGAQRRLVPTWWLAGDGGVDWDRDGRLYFVGLETESRGLTDLYRIRPDGTRLERLTHTPMVGE